MKASIKLIEEHRIKLVVENDTKDYLEIRGIEFYRRGKLSKVLSIIISLIILAILAFVIVDILDPLLTIVLIAVITASQISQSIARLLRKKGYRKSILDKCVYVYPLRTIISPGKRVEYTIPLVKPRPEYLVVKASKGKAVIDIPGVEKRKNLKIKRKVRRR